MSSRSGNAVKGSRTADEPVWQLRYYDFNSYSERKFRAKLRYMYGNRVHRGLVKKPTDW